MWMVTVREEKRVSSTIEQVVLTAPDISCGHCVATVKEAVGALEGVQSVDASTETKQIRVIFNPSQVSQVSIELALDEAGYPVQK
jgi:copper chaperone